ncbi:MAG: hypothetical protein WCW52_06950 [Elusimicrobiales bacterium]|jgi:hypothetical protein
MKKEHIGNVRGNEYIPVSIRISMEEAPYWGRILAISPDELELLSKFEFKKGRTLSVGFELDKEKLEDIRGAVTAILREPSGYFQYFIKLSDHNQQKNLLNKLLNLTRGQYI